MLDTFRPVTAPGERPRQSVRVRRMFGAAGLGAAVLAGALAGPAWANTITDSYGPTAFNLANALGSSIAIPRFNPAEGTLTAVSVSYDLGATLLFGVTASGHVAILDSSLHGTSFIFPSMTGPATPTFAGSFAIPAADLGDFEVSAPDILVGPHLFTNATDIAGSISGTITYTFNPAAAVPEPSTASLFGLALGIFGLGLCRARGGPRKIRCVG